MKHAVIVGLAMLALVGCSSKKGAKGNCTDIGLTNGAHTARNYSFSNSFVNAGIFAITNRSTSATSTNVFFFSSCELINFGIELVCYFLNLLT